MILRQPWSPARLEFSSAGVLMTREEFEAVPEQDEHFRYELIDGVLVVSPMPSDAELSPNDLLGYFLRHYQRTHPQGSCLDETVFEREVRTARNNRRVDRAIWIGLGRAPVRREDVPAIVVEFVSPGRRAYLHDYVQKRDEYLQAGVREYWVIDRFDRTLTVFRGAAPEETVIAETETYQTPLLPGFELPLAELLKAADRFADS